MASGRGDESGMQWGGGVDAAPCLQLPAGIVDREGGVALLACSPHTSKQLSATTACIISLRNAAVSESDQTGFTSRRETVEIL